MLKSSRYNFWARLSSSRSILFNGVTGALIEMDDSERRQVEDLLKCPGQLGDSSVAGIRETMERCGFLVSEPKDEYASLCSEGITESRQHSVWDIVVSPTYECNFRCSYCYCDFRTGRMSQDTEHSVVTYIEDNLHRYSQVNLSWFGGEPLLCLDTVLRASRAIRQAAARIPVELNMFIATNGYELDTVNAARLYEAGVEFFHVTVDGAAPHHDRRRILSEGFGTHDRIIDNLLKNLESLPGAHFTLRVNADHENIDSVSCLLDMVPTNYRSRIQVNITPTLHDDKVVPADLYPKINSTLRSALEKGYLYYDNLIQPRRKVFCVADKEGNFQIGWDGSLYKCSPGKLKPEVEVGRLTAAGKPVFNEGYAAWHATPQWTVRCAECRFYCFCAGGCRLQRLRGEDEGGCRNSFCDIENMIVNRYLAFAGGKVVGSAVSAT